MVANNSQDNLNVPSLIISLDNFSAETVAIVKNIHNRSRGDLKNLTDYYQVFYNLKERIIAIEKLGTEPIISNLEYESSRPEIYQDFIGSLDTLKSSLQKMLLSVLDHNRLISSGYSFDHDIPLNIFLIADCKDELGSALLIPMLFLLNDYATKQTSTKLHILLNIASFADEENYTNQGMMIFTLFSELLEILKKSSEIRKRIFKDLDLIDRDFSSSYFYCFHNTKEDPGVVVSNRMMATMIGNALLTLLMDDIANKITQPIKQNDGSLESFIINSIGAVSVIYDPESLQKYCAQRLAIKTIDEVLLSEGQKGAASIAASQVINKIGDSKIFTRNLLKIHLDSISQIIYNQENQMYDVTFKDLELKDIEYINFPKLPWNSELIDLESRLETIVQNELNTEIQKNITCELERVNQIIELFANNLPQDIALYPGGIDSSKLSLLDLKRLLLAEKQHLTEQISIINNKKDKPTKKTEKIKETFARIIENIPPLPKIIENLPEKIGEVVAAVYYHIVYFVPLAKLYWYRAKLPILLQKIAGFDVNILAKDNAKALIDILCDDTGVINVWLKKLDYLHDCVEKIKEDINSSISFPLGLENNVWEEYFRIPIVTQEVADNIFQSHDYSEDNLTIDLIKTYKIFDKWNSSDFNLIDKIIAFTQLKFESVWNLDLQDIHHLFDKIKSKVNSPLTQSNLLEYLAISQPLLQPLYTASDAAITRYYLIGDTSWSDFNISHDKFNSEEWEILWSNNLYSLFVVQVWQNVTYASISDLFSEAYSRYKKLSEKEKSRYAIVGSHSFVTTISETDESIEREYQWQFTPKGSQKEHTFRIRLSIDRKRYQEYCARPRDHEVGQYNLYSQADMPEINNLALEFNKIFSQYSWSTYNKAYCVLKFVQNAITYQYDKDSKQQTEWPRYPIETLAEAVGDCEDVAILCAAILIRLGFDVVLLLYPKHMAFGVCGSPNMRGDYVFDPKTGKKYYYGEATNDGWRLGEIPSDYINKVEEIIKVELLVNDDDPNQ